MEVELDSALLEAPHAPERDDLTLLGICALGFLGRHRVVPDVEREEPWNEWARALGGALHDEVKHAWDRGRAESAIGRAPVRLRVTRSNESTNLSELRLSPEPAFGLLARPLRILLENGRNDRAFLLAFADEAMRKRLEDAEQRGWLAFETAGGIGELKARLEEAQHTRDRQQLLRTLHLCDSDAQLPGQPSSSAQAVAGLLKRIERRFNASSGAFGGVLARRAAENYAPGGAVCDWAKVRERRAHEVFTAWEDPGKRAKLGEETGTPGSPRRHLLAALAWRELAAAAPDVRAVLDVKHGERGTDPSIWARLDATQQAALRDGLGEGFAASFYEKRRGLRDDDGEISAFLKHVSERL